MTDAVRPREARLGRYALWQLRDYLMDKGIATAIVLLFAGSVDYVATSAAGSLGASRLRSIVLMGFESLLGTLVLLGVLFATNGIVSDDRKNGYYRFLFAKPVSVTRFYAQKFVVSGAGFLLVSLLLLLVYNVVFSRFVPGEMLPFFPRTVVPVLAVLFVALGGIGFLMSVVWRVDWLTFMTVYILANVGWQLFGERSDWRGTLVRALPPVHRLDEVYSAVVRGHELPIGDLRWLLLYGLACFVIGLVLLGRRPLATS